MSWIGQGRRFVQALLVGVDGSAPLSEGAMMLIGDRGEIEGSITGGCVESAVVSEAEQLLAGRRAPGVLSYGISDALAGSVGLMCGGTVHIFIQQLSGPAAETELAVLRTRSAGVPVAVGVLLDGPAAGGRMLVGDPECSGSLGLGELLDRNVGREAVGLLKMGRSTIRRFGANGASMRSELRVHVRAYGVPPQMVIVGANDFSAALAPFADALGYRVMICDARPSFVASERFSRCAEVRVGWPQAVLEDVCLGECDVLLVLSHDPKFDEPALVHAVKTDVGFVGALGSRRTAREREARLRAAGLDAAALARIHSPCGLDIGSSTPEEAAIAILAEIIAERTHRPSAPLRTTAGPIRAGY